jgi:hypothetical protein
MKSIKTIIASFIILASITSCKKDKIDTTPPNPNVPITETVKDVYTGGYEFTFWDANANGLNMGAYTKAQARIWKNGVQMPIDPTPFIGQVNDIAVLGNDVYAVGIIDTATFNPFNQIIRKAAIWKNGVPTFLSLPGQTGSCSAIEISGNDIYVAGASGSTNGVGKLWKNGVVIFSEANTDIRAMKVIGNDVYMVLRQGIGSGTSGSLWKNGAYSNFSTEPTTAYPTGLAVVGADVYVCGFKTGGTFTKAMVWKNGVATELTGGAVNAAAYDVTVKNGNVYVVGHKKIYPITGNLLLFRDEGIVWENAVESLGFSNYPVGTIGNTYYRGIEFVGNDKYLVGFTRITLNDQTSYYRAGGFSRKMEVTTNMADSNNNSIGYGATALCMHITKQ